MRFEGLKLLATLWVVAPIVPVIIGVVLTPGSRGYYEPLADLIIMYIVAAVALFAAAAPLAFFAALRPAPNSSRLAVLACTFLGGAGSALLVTWLDAADDYFTEPGVGFVLPLTGMAIGACFGLAFGWLNYHPTRPV